MSELLNSSDERVEALYQMFAGFIEKKDGRELWDAYKHKLDALTPADVLIMGDRLVNSGYTPAEIIDVVEKIFNVIVPILKEFDWDEPKQGSALYYLIEENNALTNHMNEMKDTIRALSTLDEGDVEYISELDDLKAACKVLSDFEPHYVKIENVLFPYLEKTWDFANPMQVLWAVNDEIRATLKELNGLLADCDKIEIEHHQVIGHLFMVMMRMAYKENLVLFPAAASTLREEDSAKMLPEMSEIGFCMITPPKIDTQTPVIEEVSGDTIKMGGTGEMTVNQLVMMMNHLPVDITYVDDNDEVCYFNDPKDRFFTRSPAIIGRKVQNCHPPDSIDTVNQIVAAFKDGSKDSASFWIKMGGKMIMINYYAVRDKTGAYKGTIEVSQDITEIQQLEGERRILDWEG